VSTTTFVRVTLHQNLETEKQPTYKIHFLRQIFNSFHHKAARLRAWATSGKQKMGKFVNS